MKHAIKVTALILIVISSCNALSLLSPKALLQKTLFPPIPIHQENNNQIISFCTAYPFNGENGILGKQLLANTDNYLREYRHFTTRTDKAPTKYILKHAKNVVDLSISPLIIGLIGNTTLITLQDELKANKCLILFPVEELPGRKQSYPGLLYFRPSQEKELRVIASYAVKVKKRTSVGILYEESTWGKTLLAQLEKILSALNITPLATASYTQGTVEVEKALKDLSQASPNAIFCLAHPRAAYTFISNALNVGLHECQFYGLSQLNVIQRLLRATRGLDIAVTSVVPHPHQTTLPLIEEYNKIMKPFLSFREDSVFYFEAFIIMTLFEHALNSIQGDASIEKIIAFFESFKNVDFKGLKLSFDSKDRSLSSALWINPGQDRTWIPAGGGA
jgi:ABC-type branched-subunit amino acid transport system substrate-binding protein